MVSVPGELAHLPTPVVEFFLRLSTVAGLGAHEIVLFGCQLLCYVLGPIQCALGSTTLKHVYSIFFGLFIGFVVYGPSFAHCLIVPVIGYVLTRFRALPGIVSFWSLGYLSLCHLYRAYFAYMGYRLDFTMALMVSAVKTMTFAYSYHDGQVLKINKNHV
jgi:hypothetical protein